MSAENATPLSLIKEQYEVRAVKIVKDKKNDRFNPVITLHDKKLKCNQSWADCSGFCSDEFVADVLRLGAHMAVLLDRIPEEEFKTIKKDDERFNARGYSLSGAEDELRVCLKGHVKLRRVTPVQENVNNVYLNKKVSETDEDNGYPFLGDLDKQIKRIEDRVLSYCFLNDQWKDPQLSLDIPEAVQGVTNLKVVEAVTPESIVKDLVDSANAKPLPQSAERPDGRAVRQGRKAANGTK